MNIDIVCIGKLKEKYLSDACNEYLKRLYAYANVKIVELKEFLLPANPSLKDEENVKIEEGKTILKNIKDDTFVITLEVKGKELDSIELSSKIESLMVEGKSDIAFIIGGSLGLSEEVSKRSDFKLSFSKMTFPHQLMRVILLEQVYRAFKIMRNETYHK